MNAASGKALDDFLVRQGKIDRFIDRSDLRQSVRLWCRPGEAVENETFGGIGSSQPITDEFNRELVGYEFSAIEYRFHLLAEFGLVLDVVAENISRRYVRGSRRYRLPESPSFLCPLPVVRGIPASSQLSPLLLWKHPLVLTHSRVPPRRGQGYRVYAPEFAANLLISYCIFMSVWNDLNRNFSKKSKKWISWAKQHAQEIGEAGVRHIERQDLLSERKNLIRRIGEEVTNRFLIEEKKTLCADSAAMADILGRISAIDRRLEELATSDEDDSKDV